MAYGDFVTTVGAEVGVIRRSRSYGNLTMALFGTVTKINGHGHIFVKCGDREFRFTRRGDSYHEVYGPSLCHAEQLCAELDRENKRKETARLARELEGVVKNGWSYSGTFHVNADDVAKMKALVNQLEKMVDKAPESV